MVEARAWHGEYRVRRNRLFIPLPVDGKDSTNDAKQTRLMNLDDGQLGTQHAEYDLCIRVQHVPQPDS